MKTRISVPLNKQQLELLDRTLALGLVGNRAELLRLALREYSAAHPAAHPAAPVPTPATSKADRS